MRVAILQPGYLPWLGFFDQMARVDTFVLYDDVQYDKHGWRNRNRIKTVQGVQWLTVPVMVKGKGKPLVKDVLIDNNTDWRKNHLRGIQQSYIRTPFFDAYSGGLEKVYAQTWERLIDADTALITLLKTDLGIQTEIVLSSDLQLEGDRIHRLIDLCVKLGATEFLEGSAGRSYLEGEGEQLFARNGITIHYHDYTHPVYPQLYGAFVSHVSVIDLLYNCGPDSLKILTNGKVLT